jgi:hypothetical protein
MLQVGKRSLHPERTTQHPRGSSEVYAAGKLVICVARGHIVADDANALIEVLNARLHEGPLTGFYDWEAVEGYESAARKLLTEWTSKAPRGAVREVHFLFRSRLVAMGIATAGLALRLMGLQLVSHSARRDFEARLTAALIP